MSRVNVKDVQNTTDIIEKLTAAELGLNVLYLDLNSCFATTEQQARPMLRHKPVAIANRMAGNSALIAASYEAKAKGVKVGMRRREAEQLCPDIIFVETEPSKYIYVHNKLKSILKDYSPNICMKSVDEGLIDLTSAPIDIKTRPILEIAREIKTRIHTEIGSYMSCNIGLGANRFLAKLAAELHKPDGLDMIIVHNILIGDKEIPSNIREVFSHLKLTDLPGINVRMEHRLNTYRINTPLELLDAPEDVLRHQVCQSIEGTKWYERLRGIEVDEREDITKSIGRQFVLPPYTDNKTAELYLRHLCEDVGFRLRSQELFTRGVMVWFSSPEGHFHKNILENRAHSSDQEITERAVKLFHGLIKTTTVPIRLIGVTLYKLTNVPEEQLTLFHKDEEKHQAAQDAIDKINKRFGTRTIHSAHTLGTDEVKSKIPFGSTRYLDGYVDEA
jgi:DNA polymerase-4